MAANNRIRMHVEELFLSAPKSHRTIELKEELIANLQDKYDDLIAQGRDADMAYDLVISSIGDIDELILSLREKYIYDPEVVDMQRKKSAMKVSAAVGLYIAGLVPFTICSGIGLEMAGMAAMFLCWAAATMILVYNGMTKPKYDKQQENIVEDFKEFTRGKSNKKALRRSIHSILWTTTTIIFLVAGMLTGRWYIVWLVFLLAAVVQQIIGLLFLQDEREEK